MGMTGKCSKEGRLNSRHGKNRKITIFKQNNAQIEMQNNHQAKRRWMAQHPSLMRADGRVKNLQERFQRVLKYADC